MSANLDKIVAFLETVEGCKLSVYQDTGGKNTIGIGTLWVPNMPITITKSTAEAWCKADCAKRVTQMEPVITVDINENQWTALVSFCYNEGLGAFKGSTLLEKLNAGDIEGAADQFLVWDEGVVNGVKQMIPGLLRRRTLERMKFLEAV